MFYRTFFLLCLFFCTECYAQELKVLEFTETPNDLIARTQERKDINGVPCGVVRIAIAMPDISFDGWIVDKQQRPGEYIVYLAENAKKITIMHPSCIPFEYTFPQPIEGKHTYRLVLEMPKTNQTYVRLKSNVKKAQLQLGGQTFNTSDGNITLSLPNGIYDYSATTIVSGFSPVQGKLVVENQAFLEESLMFTSKQSYVLNVNTDANAQIVIDGKTQKKGVRQFTLPAGIHHVEASWGDGNIWRKAKEIDMSEGNLSVDLNMRGILRIVYPSNAQFEITALSNALPLSKKTFNTGEAISLLGDYEIVVNKKNYEKTHVKISVGVDSKIENYRIDVVSKGDNYFKGINGEKQDYTKAFKEYKKMAAKEDDIAQYHLASCFEYGYGTTIDRSSAMHYWKKSSDNGNCDATYQLAQRTENDYERLNLYQLAAEQGNIPSMKIVGDDYVAKNDFENAMKYYMMAVEGNQFKSDKDIEAGIAGSLAGLGELYYHGNGVTLDRKKAYDYFVKAASRGNALALERIADYIYMGFESGIPNREKAIEKYKVIGEKLSPEGKMRVGLYEYQHNNFDEANQFFSSLAHIDMQLSDLPDYMTDVYLKMGDVMYKTDKPASFYYYSKTAEAKVSNVKQFVRLGYMYLNGFGTVKDYVLSKSNFEKSASLGDNESICMLGYFYEQGLGVDTNFDKAINYYTKAGKKGYMKAYNNLGTVYAKLKNMEKAAYYWEFAAKSGIQPAIRNLINYYKKRDNAEKVDEWTKKLK